jgi:transposase
VNRIAPSRSRASAPIECDIRGLGAPTRQAIRRNRAKPILDAVKLWLKAKLAAGSGKSIIAEAIRYALSGCRGTTSRLT